MGLLQQRETTISWDAETKVAHIWTNDPAMIARMDTLCTHKTGAYACVSRTGQSANYKCESDLICFRFPNSGEILERNRELAALKDRRSAERRKQAALDADARKTKGRKKSL